MSWRESSFDAAKAVTLGVTTVVVCLCLVTTVGTARAEAPDEPGISGTSLETQSTAPAPGAEMSPEAKAHYDRGLQLYAARDFAAAIKELELGFHIDPRREFLFAQAQAFRLAGDCDRAVPLYRRFLESDPTPLQVEAARLGLDRCGPNRVPPTATAAPVPPHLSATRTTRPPAPRSPSAPAPDRRGWWRDPWAAVAIGTGVAALATGVGFEMASANARDDAAALQPKSYPEFDRLWQTAEQRRMIAVAAGAGGAALLVVGGVRLMLLHRRTNAIDRSVGGLSFRPAHGGGTLTWQGGF